MYSVLSTQGTSCNDRSLIILSIHLSHTLFDGQVYLEAFFLYRLISTKLFGNSLPNSINLDSFFMDGSCFPPSGIPPIASSDTDHPLPRFFG